VSGQVPGVEGERQGVLPCIQPREQVS
jgi:hypothetical protein